MISAQLMGFQSQNVRLFAKFKGTAKWEMVPMHSSPSGNSFEFLFAGLPETMDYYVEADSLHSKSHTLTLVDLAVLKNRKINYPYPKCPLPPAPSIPSRLHPT